MEFWMSTEKPAPPRKRKQITSALEEHEEYLKLKNVILGGRMRPMQSAFITLGKEDQKQLGYLFPQRTAVDSLRRMVKSMGLEADWNIRKYQMDNGDWCVMATYEPPLTSAQPHAEAVQGKRQSVRSRKTA